MNKGGYLLVLKFDEPAEIKVGALGRKKFRKGFYVYVGSAMNGLEQRVNRHLRKDKKKHWHIDYLQPETRVTDVKKLPSEERNECWIARKMKKKADSEVRGFGCSDCSCSSHLFYFKQKPELGELYDR